MREYRSVVAVTLVFEYGTDGTNIIKAESIEEAGAIAIERAKKDVGLSRLNCTRASFSQGTEPLVPLDLSHLSEEEREHDIDQNIGDEHV